jgi:hypothetical protein
MFRLLLLSAVLGAGLLSGCATTDSNSDDQVSSIPWNRPERWEGGGPLGGMMNTQ